VGGGCSKVKVSGRKGVKGLKEGGVKERKMEGFESV